MVVDQYGVVVDLVDGMAGQMDLADLVGRERVDEFGSIKAVRIIATRWRMPPDNACG